MVSTPTVRMAPRVSEELLEFIEVQRRAIEPEALPLLAELAALVQAGGKRLRPIFCYWGYVAAGGTEERPIIRVGAALELLHTFALIQDDVMDRSPLRRSRSSSFRALADVESGKGDPQRFGTSAAVLTGLLGFVLSDRLLLTSGFDAETIARVAERWDSMRTRAIAGQYLDVLAAHRGDADEDTARRIASLKSAGYTIADPLVIGALCGSADERAIDVLERYGFPLGEAFQLRDDVLGTFGDPAQTGKDRDGDLREGKQTYLLAKARALADDAQLATLESLVGDRDLSPPDADRAREIIDECGAVRATDDLIDELTARAKDALDASILGDDPTTALLQLADDVSRRVT